MALSIGNPNGFTSLLREGYQHFEEAVYRNIHACMDLVRVTRTSFGPHGMSKLVVNSLGKLFVTSDAATITRELDIVHPAAKMLVMASTQQEAECGDGTNFVLMLAGELLKQAEELLRIGIHCSDIVAGYELAGRHALEILESLVVGKVEAMDDPRLVQAVENVVGAKQHGYGQFLARLVVDAALHVMPEDHRQFNVDSIRVVRVLGSGLMSSQVVPGMVFARQPESNVKQMRQAKIGVFSCPLDIGRTETKGTVLLADSKQLLEFSRGEESILEEQFKAIYESGIRVMVTMGAVGDQALHFINRLGLMVVRVPSKFDILRLCRATGATPLARLGPPTPEEIGCCDVVETIEIGGDRCTLFRQETRMTKTATIVLRGSTTSYLEDVERSIDNGVNAIKSLTRDGKLLAGAGAVEMELATRLGEIAEKTPGLAQYAIQKYSEALCSIPHSLCENAGLNPEVMLSKLHARHQTGEACAGVNIDDMACTTLDAVQGGILDVYLSKRSGLYLATGAAVDVLRVDTIVMSKQAGGPKPRESGPMDED